MISAVDTPETSTKPAKIYPIQAFSQYADWLTAATFTRQGGVSAAPFGTLNTGRSAQDNIDAIRENRRRATERLGLNAHKLRIPSLLHTTAVGILNSHDSRLPTYNHDAVVTKVSGVPILMSTADCAPVFFADPKNHIAGIAHAGWKGVDGNICREVVRTMLRLGTRSPADIHVWVGPSIGPCCYHHHEIPSQSGRPTWKNFITSRQDGLYVVDLWGALSNQLKRLGILPENLALSRICTACHSDQYFSNHKEGNTGRFPSLLCIQ